MAKTRSARPKGPRSGHYYIQPIWRIYGLCEAGWLDFPPYIDVPRSIFDIEGLSNEALAYYVYWLAGNQRLQEWSSQHERDLNLSAKQVKRLRAELRKHGLLTVTRAGKQTYSVIHGSPIPLEDRERVGSTYALFIKRQWGLAQHYGITNHVDSVTPFFQIHVGVPAGKTMVVFRDSIRRAANTLLSSNRGMNRLRALGLWLKLCNKPAWHNWETPSNIAKEFGVSRKYILAHFKELLSLGLAIYLEEDRMIGISRFPGGVEEELHPASTDTAHIPWKYLLHGSVRPQRREIS